MCTLDIRQPGMYSGHMTETQNPQPETLDEMVGQTWHVLRGTKYHGTFHVDAATPSEGDWYEVRDGKVSWHLRLQDCYRTEEQARSAARALRKPRQPRTPQPLYGDYAQLAALHGLRTDGTGRRAR